MVQREAGDGRHRDTAAMRRTRTIRAGAAGVLTVAAAASVFAWHGSIDHGSMLTIGDGAVAGATPRPGETLVTTAPAVVGVTAAPSVSGTASGSALTPTPSRVTTTGRPGTTGATGSPTGKAGQPALVPASKHTTTTKPATTKPTTTRGTTRTTPPSTPAQPSSPSSPPTTAPTTPTTPSGVMSAAEQQVVDLTNAARATAGCDPLTVNTSLVEAAHDHADDMVAGQYFAHTSPSGVTVQDRATTFGFTGGVGENIEAGSSSAADAFNAWYSEGPSGGHYQNIVNCSYKYIGVGFNAGAIQPYSAGVWAQVFG